MRVAIEARPMAVPKGGIGYYTQNLVEHLLKRDAENEYILFYFNLSPKQSKNLPAFDFSKNYSNLVLPKQVLRFGLRALKKPDVVHGTNYRLLAQGAKGSVVTVHDLGFMRFPQFMRKFGSWKMVRRVQTALSSATAVITVSENSKKDILEYFNFPQDRVAVTYEGVNEKFFQAPDAGLVESVKKKFNITKPFILFVGALGPRKNIPTLIRAYAAAKPLHNDFQLVLAGGFGWAADEIFDAMETSGVKKNIIVTQYVPSDELHALYHGASLFVFPSLYEGFGLPLLEAMACGVPVISSNVSSLPEVAGDAAVLVDPNSVEQLKHNMEKVLCDSVLREQLILKGFERAKLFSWEKTAAQTLNLYEKVFHNVF